MIPVYLKFSGLQSYVEEQHIDFSELVALGLFGIFGPTGSGKSTILDAITLALYGHVERADRGTQGILNHLCDTLTLEFTFVILQDGEHQRYRVERVYRKGGDDHRPSAHRTLLVRILADGTEIPIADQKTEVDENIRDILGLTLQDFTKAVMLPQGRFAEFLHLKGRERRNMLERLFGLEQYGAALIRKLNQVTAETDSSRASFESEQLGLRHASPEALRQAKKDLEAARKALEVAKSVRTRADKEHREAERVWDLMKDRDSASARIALLQERSEAYTTVKAELLSAENAEYIRPALDTTRTRSDELDRCAGLLAGKEAELQTAKQTLSDAEQRLKDADLAWKQRSPEYEARLHELRDAARLETRLKDLEADLLELETEINRLASSKRQNEDRLNTLRKNEAKFKTLLDKTDSEIARLDVSPQMRQLVAESVAALDEFERLEKEANAALSAFGSAESAAISAKKDHETALEKLACIAEMLEPIQQTLAQLETRCLDEVGERINHDTQALIRMRSAAKAYADALDQHALLAQKLGSADVALEAKRQGLDACNADILANEDALERAMTALALAKAEKEKRLEQMSAIRLSAGLEQGKPCPVCGSTHHPEPVRQTDERGLARFEARLAKAEGRAERLVAEKNRLTANRAVLESETKAAISLRETLLDDAKTASELVAECASVLPADWSADHKSAQQLLDNMERDIRLRRQALDSDRSLLANTKREIDVLKTGLADQNTACATTATRAEELGKIADAKKAEADACAERFRIALQCLDSVREDIMVDQIRETAATIREHDTKRRELVGTRSDTQRQADKASEEVSDTKRAIDALDLEISVIMNERRRVQSGYETDAGRLDSITLGQPSERLAEETRKARSCLEEARTAAEEAVQTSRRQHDAIAQKHATLLGEHTNRTRLLEEARAHLEDSMEKHGMDGIDHVVTALRPQDERDRMRAQTKAYEEEMRKANAELERCESALSGEEMTEERWESVQRDSKDAQDAELEASRLVGSANEAFRIADSGHARWLELESSKEASARLLADYRALSKVLRGNAFVDYVAEEYLTAVALDASERLGALTRYRYALMVDSEGGFVVRDDHNGGLCRPISTLSGGETFLASLALALALSSQIQMRGQSPLEFFFLDEGFGSLDPEALSLVLDALDRLKNDRMTIGVISHVPELFERISHKIVVSPAQPGGGSSLRIETTR